MDVSGVSNTSASQQVALRASVHIAARSSEKGHDSDHQFRPPTDVPRDRALGVFKQELQTSLRTHFRARIAINQSNYAAVQGAPTPDDVATEALGAAKQLVSEAPASSGRALISFRSTVHETASYVRQTVALQDDIAAVDDAVSRIDDGLDALETEVAANQESTASVLTVDSRSKQRSTIRIRTQEGDIVKLNLKQYDSVSAKDTAITNGDGASSSTEVEVSSRSRLTLKVNGDLNENELAAIQDVFSQAEEIANQFFGGDLAAAFDLAAGFEFDSEQLARVKLGFRNFQSSSVSYTESTSASPTVAAANPPKIDAAPDTGKPDSAAPAAGPVAVQALPAAEVTQTGPGQNESEAAIESPPAPTFDTSALSDFFGLVSDFLRSIGDGFEGSGASSSTSVRFHYSESFKLELLSTVVKAAAPDHLEDAASTASLVIDSIAAANDDENARIT